MVEDQFYEFPSVQLNVSSLDDIVTATRTKPKTLSSGDMEMGF